MGLVILAGSLPAPADMLAPASEDASEGLLVWAFVKVLDPYGNKLPEAEVWVNPRSSSPAIQLIDFGTGWYLAGGVRRGLTDATALLIDYILTGEENPNPDDHSVTGRVLRAGPVLHHRSAELHDPPLRPLCSLSFSAIVIVCGAVKIDITGVGNLTDDH